MALFTVRTDKLEKFIYNFSRKKQDKVIASKAVSFTLWKYRKKNFKVFRTENTKKNLSYSWNEFHIKPFTFIHIHPGHNKVYTPHGESIVIIILYLA